MTETEIITYVQQAIDAVKPAAGEVATTVVKNAVWEWIKGKMTGERAKAVDAVEAKPGDDEEWDVLQSRLKAALKANPALAEDLKALLEKDKPATGAGINVTGDNNRIAHVQGSNNRTIIR